jgi:hypothetical protein
MLSLLFSIKQTESATGLKLNIVRFEKYKTTVAFGRFCHTLNSSMYRHIQNSDIYKKK